MDAEFAVGLLTCVFLGAVLLLAPHFTPRRHLFGVTVPADFRNTDVAHRAWREYHAEVVGATFLAIGLVGSFALVPFLIPTVACVAYWRAWKRVRPYAVPSGPPAPHLDTGHLPRWMALAAVPYAALLLVAAWLRAHWDEIPARFPIHWGANGQPNGWAEKTVRGVYGPLMFGAGIALLILMLALGSFYGSRPSRMRAPMLAIMISATYVMAFAFGSAALLPLVHFSPAFFIVPIAAYVVAVVVLSFKLSMDNPGEETPDECWSLGGIYYNPSDPAVFVQKRFGVGYTMNFGNHRSWLYIGIFVAGILGLIFLLPR